MNKTFDRYTGIILLLLGIGIVTQSFSISQSVNGSAVGPRTFPMGLGSMLVLLSLRLIYETFKYKVSEKADSLKLDYKRFGLFLCALLLYAALLETLGYVICTFVFLLVAFQLMKKEKWIRSTVIAAAFSGIVYYLYVVVMNGNLPGFPTWLS